MQMIIKIFLSLGVILAATEIAKKMPSLARLLAVMPLPLVLFFSFGSWAAAALMHQWLVK